MHYSLVKRFKIMYLKIFIAFQTTILFLSPTYLLSHNLDQEEIAYPTSYVYPVDDDRTIPLPYITLRAKLIRHTFPGTPNYESIEGGDMPETRWVLEVPGSEIRRLIDSNYLTEDLYYPDKNGWIQLIAVGDEESPSPLLNKQVIVQGYLGTLISHIHTPATLEAKEMHEDIQ
jgi:hypothetical protein